MNTFEICEALYALPGGVVEARRRPIIKPIATILIGIVLLVINFVAIDSSMEALSMLLLVLGVGVMIYGIIVVVMRCGSDEQVPYHTPSKSYMRYSERFYDRSQLGKLQSAIESGDRSAIDSIPTSNISAIILACYRSANGSIVAYGLYHYVDMEYCLIGDVTIKEMS
jgi:hypothetical protein